MAVGGAGAGHNAFVSVLQQESAYPGSIIFTDPHSTFLGAVAELGPVSQPTKRAPLLPHALIHPGVVHPNKPSIQQRTDDRRGRGIIRRSGVGIV